MIAALSARIDASELRAEVSDLARRHGITNDDDVSLLRSIPDAQQRAALAVRLKPSQEPAPLPPDPGQGPRPNSPQSDTDAEYLQFYPDQKRS